MDRKLVRVLASSDGTMKIQDKLIRKIGDKDPVAVAEPCLSKGDLLAPVLCEALTRVSNNP